jgi:arylsulfatase A
MQRARQGFVIIVLILALTGVGYGQIDRSPTTRPNIILIVADDLGYGDLACYGHKIHQTPNIDKLAQGGMKFLDFHSNGVVCSPTRAALLTGKYPQSTGITGVITAKDHRDTGLDLSEILLSEILKGNKYRTGIVGKWHLGYDPAYSPVRQGFDSFKGYVSGNVDYISHYDQENFFDWWQNTDKLNEEGYTTDLITQHALSFIDQNRDGPFFLYVAHEAPHAPYQVRESKPERTGKPDYKSKPESDKKKIYGQMIEIMDEGIGKIMAALDEHKLSDNTLVLFISDNGANDVGSNYPFKGHKGQVWEGGHRIPAIAYWKGMIKPNTSNELLMTMDVLPTISELTGSKIPGQVRLEGVSFKNTLFGKRSVRTERPVFWSFKNSAAVRNGNWKLVRVNDQNYLYDLEADPGEVKNVFVEFPSIAQRLSHLLEQWEKEKSKVPAKS